MVAFSRGAAAALLLLPLFFTGRALLTGRVYAPVDLAYSAEPLASMARDAGITHLGNTSVSDVYAQFIPWNAALRWALAHHEWPLWNPFELAGGVLAPAAQSAPYHPFTLVALLLPQPAALTFSATLALFVAALSGFLFARDLELHELAALFAAAAWAFSTDVLMFLETAHGNSVAMMPFVLLAARRAGRTPLLLVIALSLLLLCGHPESALHIVFFGCVYALFEMRREEMKRAIGFAFAAGAATLLLLAFFLLPLVDAMTQTREWLHRTSPTGASLGGSPFALTAHLLPTNFVPFLEGESGVEMASHPRAHGVMGTAYVGALAFAPALYALWRARGRRTWFFLGVVAFGILMGAGTPGLTDVFARLPLFSIAVNARMVSFAAFGIAVLAGIGVDAFLRDRSGGMAAALQIVTIAVVGLIVVMAPASGLTASFVRVGAARALLPLLLALAMLFVFERRAFAIGLLALLLLQRASEAGRIVPSVDRRAFYPPIAGLPRGGLFRIVGQGELFTPNIAAHYGLEDVRGYQAMTLARFAETFPLWCTPQPVWSNRVDDLTKPMLSLMNVRFALAPARSRAPEGWRSAGSYRGFELFENDRALPRAFVPALVHPASADVIAQMARCSDFGQEAWIDGASGERRAASGSVSISRRGTRLRMHVSLASPGYVVVSEPAWRGWRVFEGDRELPVTFADHAFVAFELPAGEHEVRMFFRPRSFTIGLWISAAALLALLTSLALRFRARS